MTTDDAALVERMAAGLELHQPSHGGHLCTGCDWTNPHMAQPFKTHQATALLPEVRKAQAEAWDEAYHGGYRDGENSVDGWGLASHAERENDTNLYQQEQPNDH